MRTVDIRGGAKPARKEDPNSSRVTSFSLKGLASPFVRASLESGQAGWLKDDDETSVHQENSEASGAIVPDRVLEHLT